MKTEDLACFTISETLGIAAAVLYCCLALSYSWQSWQVTHKPMEARSMVDERGYCTDCDGYDCLHAKLYSAQCEVEYWKRKAQERVVAGGTAHDAIYQTGR
jgi:hypothetical protein